MHALHSSLPHRANPPPQGTRAGAEKPAFVPLGLEEQPMPGMLFALDAEFVSYSPPLYSTLKCVHVCGCPVGLGFERVLLFLVWGVVEGPPLAFGSKPTLAARSPLPPF